MRRLSIFLRMVLVVTLTAALMATTTIYFLVANYRTLRERENSELRREVDIALAIVALHRGHAAEYGEDDDAALAHAFDEVSMIKFGADNYFHVYQGTTLRFHGGMPAHVGQDLRSLKDASGLPVVERIADDIAKHGESGFLYYGTHPETNAPAPKIAYNRRVPGTDYWLGASVYIHELEQNFWRGVREAASVAFGLTLSVLLICAAISRSVTAPLKRLKNRMARLAEGDASSPVPEVAAPDEIGEMARALEVFCETKSYACALEAANTEIEEKALHDTLTGLPNRRYFYKAFAQIRDICRCKGERMALLTVDLDHFKAINDSLGHAAGDAVLQHVAKVLRRSTRDSDFVARLGGDEFVIIGSTAYESAFAHGLAQRILRALADPLPFQGGVCRFGASIGVAFADGAAAHPDQLLKNADLALYKAKQEGRNRCAIYSDDLKEQEDSLAQTRSELLLGLREGHFTPYYQAQFDATSLDVVGVEALARWRHPRRGVLTPAAFLGIAETENVLPKLDMSIARQALRDCLSLRESGVDIQRFSVNVSAQFLKEPAVSDLIDEIAPHGLAFSLELLGSGPIDESDGVVAHNIDRLREIGAGVELDDFGHSDGTLLQLMKIQPHRLKIDPRLVDPIISSSEHRTMVRAIIGMSKALGVETIAEGVETDEHRRVLRDLGCDAVQGFAFARPMPFDALRDFLCSGDWRRAS